MSSTVARKLFLDPVREEELTDSGEEELAEAEFDSWVKSAGQWERVKWFMEVENEIDQQFVESYFPVPKSIRELKNQIDQPNNVKLDDYIKFKKKKKEQLNRIYKFFIYFIATFIEQLSLISPVSLQRSVVNLGSFNYGKSAYNVNAFYRKENEAVSIEFNDRNGRTTFCCKVGIAAWSSTNGSLSAEAECDQSKCLKVIHSIPVNKIVKDDGNTDFYFKMLQTLIEIAQQNQWHQINGIELRIRADSSTLWDQIQMLENAHFEFQRGQRLDNSTPRRPGVFCAPLRLYFPLKSTGWSSAIHEAPILSSGVAVMPMFLEESLE